MPGVMAEQRFVYRTDADDVWDFHAVYGLAGQQNSGPEDRRKENDRRTVDHSISHVLRSDVRRKPDRDGADLWDRNGKRNRR